jgi:Xaa-Pro aminopeptidase
MKHGLIAWDKTELPEAAFETRLAAARRALAERGLPALIVYTDICKSDRARYLSNFMPYWNRALLVIPMEGKPVLLCSLSPRVYPWIKSTTILEEIKFSPNLAQAALDLSLERIGIVDLDGLPYDLHTELCAGKAEVIDVPWSAVRQADLDEWELAMYRRASAMAREVLEQEMPAGVGLVDHEFVGRLERKCRRAGAEDLIVLVTNGVTPPAPPTGAILNENFSVSVALEYRGHWARYEKSHRDPLVGRSANRTTSG